MKLLIIEDNIDMLTTLQRTLERRGFVVSTCGDGARALERWEAAQPDAVLLDLSLPGLDGLQVLSQARARGLAAPVLITTARGTVGDRVVGLNSGADDYLAKPFDLGELEARIRALLRRRGAGQATSSEVRKIRFGSLMVDVDQGAVYNRGVLLDLSTRESAMLRALVARQGEALSKERLFELMFGQDSDAQFEAVEVVAYRLRKKLIGTSTHLVTLRGLGYVLKETT
jgi:two-component system, OmpR family, response regulator TctD